ncbi:glucuronate isomerase [Luteimicrobium xylanilyticum]|uniref:Uronate isomerase n=1 Tax=Luteimicrobium xylanilyticum TaxID=1133546 RepID=A0A5P9QEX0_9MICO|nr:glucuronate isomerase [Luteimicrobium xylanilyticum]QFV00012.1 Glucuronate isomerase [Luteimicrobium xylanilyticum]
MPASIDPASAQPWTLHPDRALPADPAVRPIARDLYAQTKGLPLVSMHGHVPVEWFADNRAFPNPAELIVVPDHYLVRLLVSQGLRNEQLGVRPVADGAGVVVEEDPREVWRRFCAGWKHFRGTATRFWLETALVEIFGVTQRPSEATADATFDAVAAVLADEEFRPRRLLDRFGIEIIATTDPAWATLDDHAKLAADGYGDRVVPTFRPDPVVLLDRPTWRADVERLGEASGEDVATYAGYLAALRVQRARFKAAGARATDHGHLSADTTPLTDTEAGRIYAAALAGEATAADADAFAGHMLFQMAAMSAEDGLVMQLHPGVLRDHDRTKHAVFGPDTGFDIPVVTEYTRSLRPLLEAFGHHPGFRVVLFTVDEDTFSRELAPLAGVYPAVRLGAPWWFLDAPDAMRRFREDVTETAGFSNMSGFVDDTRAFCSIPARHDLARRVDAGYLARLVAEHRLDLDEAVDTAIDLAYRLPLLAYAKA